MMRDENSRSRLENGRFKKGQSGNPKGRPKGSSRTRYSGLTSAFDILFEYTVSTSENDAGGTRKLTLEEALQESTYRNAVSGDRVAQTEVLKMIAKRENYLATQANSKGLNVEVKMEAVDPTSANAAMLLLGIVDYDPDRQGPEFEGDQLLLEPWVVQMALSRRRGGSQLTQEDIAAIKRCTRHAHTLRWPRGTRS